jgi:hypothetical protein
VDELRPRGEAEPERGEYFSVGRQARENPLAVDSTLGELTETAIARLRACGSAASGEELLEPAVAACRAILAMKEPTVPELQRLAPELPPRSANPYLCVPPGPPGPAGGGVENFVPERTLDLHKRAQAAASRVVRGAEGAMAADASVRNFKAALGRCVAVVREL